MQAVLSVAEYGCSFTAAYAFSSRFKNTLGRPPGSFDNESPLIPIPRSIRPRSLGGAVFCALGLACLSPRVEAQADNAVLTARDAFGSRVGIETVGIYTETQVRGFSIANTGAYRIDGAYFVREFQLPDSVLSGVSVISGVNGARLAYPSPSGVVDYALRRSRPGDRNLSATFSLRDYGHTVFESAFSFATKDGRFGIAGGALVTTPIEFPNDWNFRVNNGGVIPEWRPNDQVRLRALFAVDSGRYRGDSGYLSAEGKLPPRLKFHNFMPPWGRVKRDAFNTGFMFESVFEGGFIFDASTFYAQNKREPYDFALWTLRSDSTGDLSLNRTAEGVGRSLSNEALAGYEFATGPVVNTVTAAVRNRRSRTTTAALAPFRAGLFDLSDTNDFPFPDEPRAPLAPPESRSIVDQRALSLGYIGLFGDAVELRAGLHRSRYEQAARGVTGVRSAREESRWLYNASIIFALNDRLTLFADTVKGLEDTGVAPQSARNREEVLPPVVAETVEAGLRYALTPNLALTTTAFQVKKSTTGLRPDGIFAIVGNARHRGIEMSLSGDLRPGTAIVFGALLMQPRLFREAAPTVRPVGVSRNVFVVNVNQVLPESWLGPGWSVDGRLTYQSRRVANLAHGFTTTPIANLTLGARYEFRLGSLPSQLRVQAVNVATTRPWNVGPNGILFQGEPMRFRISLRVNLL
jgi:iron complex outermembrane receptor protein